jgi:thiol-disulfide isomerase/thioredoxin
MVGKVMTNEAPEKPKKTSILKVLIPVVGIIILAAIGLTLIKEQTASKKAASTSEQAPAEVRVGSTLPDIALQRFQGKPTHLSELGAKVVLINFWATWCEACLVEMPSIIELRKAFKAKGFDVAAVNVDEKPEAVLPPALKKLGIDFPVYTDSEGKLGDFFDIHAIPLTVIVDKNRKILMIQSGDFQWNSSDMRAQVSQWLGE